MTLIQFVRTYFPFQISLKQTKDLMDYVARYEIRGDNAQAFNTPYLALKYGVFLPTDAQSIFDIFGVFKQDFDRKLKEVGAINQNFNVISDSFNIFCVILGYKFITSSLPQKTAIDGFTAIMKLMNYKFFTGKVRVSFPHKANEGVMLYTIDHLSLKSDIKDENTKTWRLMIESHVQSLLAPTSPHYQTFRLFTTDEKVLRIISDMSTRIAQKIINIATEYYNNHKAGNTIMSVDAKYNANEEGEAELRAIKSHLDNKIVKISGQCLNVNSFINFGYSRLIANMCNNVRPDMMKDMLQIFSAVATQQAKNQEDMLVMKENGNTLFVGYKILITEIIQKCYRHCTLEGVDLSANIKILQAIGQIMRASRLADEDLLRLKDSVDYFVDKHLHYTREATKVSMRTAFILYIILLTFE